MRGVRRVSPLLLALAAGALVAVACTTFDGLVADVPGAGDDAGAESGASSDAAADTTTGGDDGGVGSDGGAKDSSLDDAGCPHGRGPTMVNIGKTCVDSTEVSNAEYAKFVNNVVPAQVVAKLPGACQWKTSVTPDKWPAAAAQDSFPVSGVDWCDAYAYCAWAGKRLCGLTGTSDPPPNHERNDAAANEWFNACSGGVGNNFPYGPSYLPNACNGSDRNQDSGLTVAVGSIATCVGGFPGLYDLSGNVSEWENYCADDAGANDLCRQRGGAADDEVTTLDCTISTDAGGLLKRNYRSPHKGIRCCATPGTP